MSMTREDNELMTRVAGGAPMGGLLREHYWFPAALSRQFRAGAAPERVRLLGSNFIGWRDREGRLGFFDEACPHRRASLMLARNEEGGLRCIFHGWKFSAAGEVLEVPTEPYNPEVFARGVPLRHHPVREAAGIVWAWLGSGKPAPLPEFEFMNLPEDRVYSVRQNVRYNWVQSIEGGMDAAHVPVLHQDWLAPLSNNGTLAAAAGHLAPVYEFEDKTGGFRYAAIRTMGDGRKHIRLNEFVSPWYCFIAAETGNRGDRTLNISVPVDDVTTIYWTVRYNPFAPIGPSVFNPAADPCDWPPYLTGGPEERWGQNREAMEKGGAFSGFGFPHTTEDFAVGESQGTIADRSQEYLGAGDRAVVRVRTLLLDAVKSFQGGQVPDIARHEQIAYPSVRPMSDIVDAAFDWHRLAA